MVKYKGITVKVYYSHAKFPEIVKLAEKAGKRRVGLQLYCQSEIPFSDKKRANTDGIAPFLKMASIEWGHRDVERAEAKLLLEQEKRATAIKEENMKKRGLI